MFLITFITGKILCQKRNTEHIFIHFKVNISHNQIEQINNGAFKFCENMTVLDLSHNKIKRLAPDTFDKNSYTTELKLNDNQVLLKKYRILFYKAKLIWNDPLWYLLHFSFLVDINEPSTNEISKRNQDLKCQSQRNTGRTKKDFSKGRIIFEILLF